MYIVLPFLSFYHALYCNYAHDIKHLCLLPTRSIGLDFLYAAKTLSFSSVRLIDLSRLQELLISYWWRCWQHCSNMTAVHQWSLSVYALLVDGLHNQCHIWVVHVSICRRSGSRSFPISSLRLDNHRNHLEEWHFGHTVPDSRSANPLHSCSSVIAFIWRDCPWLGYYQDHLAFP